MSNEKLTLSATLEQLPPAKKHESRKTYRQYLAESLRAAHAYRGAEAEYQGLFDSLIQLEEWLRQNFAEGIRRLSDDEERCIAASFHPQHPERTVANILELTASRFEKLVLHAATNGEKAGTFEQLGIMTKTLDGVLLPPSDFNVPKTGANIPIEVEYVNKLQQLIVLLNRYGIHTDDIIGYEGKVTPQMMRKVGYRLVEIPRLNVQILVCDQVNEATFVIHGLFDPQSLLRLKKEELEGQYAHQLSRIIYRSSDQWQEALVRDLFEDIERKPARVLKRAKIKVVEFDKIRQSLGEKYTLEQWLAMKFSQKREIEVEGAKYTLIARAFGIMDAWVFRSYYHLEIAAQAYGEDQPLLKPLLVKARAAEQKRQELGKDPARWKAEIRKAYSFESWIGLSFQEKKDFDFYGNSLFDIAEICGYPDIRPTIYALDFFTLTNYLFPEEVTAAMNKPKDDKARKFIEKIRKLERHEKSLQELGKDPEQWREAVKKNRSSEEWANTPIDEIDDIMGVGAQRIATIFNLSHEGSLRKRKFLELGLVIYGENDPYLKKALEAVSRDQEKIKEVLCIRYFAAQWARMTSPEKDEIEVDGKSLWTIGNIFGVDGNPINNHEAHLRLGCLVFPLEEVEIYIKPLLDDYQKWGEWEEDAEKCQKSVIDHYAVEEFLAKEPIDIIVCGRKLLFLARIFGIKNLLPYSVEMRLRVAEKVYGKDHPAVVKERARLAQRG